MEYTIPFNIPDLKGFNINWDEIDCNERRIEIPINGECGISINKYKGWDNEPRQLLYTDVFCSEYNRKYLPTTLNKFEAYFNTYIITEEYLEKDIAFPYYCWNCVTHGSIERVIKEYGYQTEIIYGYINIERLDICTKFKNVKVDKNKRIIYVTMYEN